MGSWSGVKSSLTQEVPMHISAVNCENALDWCGRKGASIFSHVTHTIRAAQVLDLASRRTERERLRISEALTNCYWGAIIAYCCCDSDQFPDHEPASRVLAPYLLLLSVPYKLQRSSAIYKLGRRCADLLSSILYTLCATVRQRKATEDG